MKETTLAKCFLKVTVRPSFLRLRVIRRINRVHEISKWKISFKGSVVSTSYYLNHLAQSCFLVGKKKSLKCWLGDLIFFTDQQQFLPNFFFSFWFYLIFSNYDFLAISFSFLVVKESKCLTIIIQGLGIFSLNSKNVI